MWDIYFNLYRGFVDVCLEMGNKYYNGCQQNFFLKQGYVVDLKKYCKNCMFFVLEIF